MEKEIKKEQIENDDLQINLEKLQQEAENNLNGWKRAQADYANLQKESANKVGEAVKFGNATLLSELLPIQDNFRKAFAHIPNENQKDDWVVGLKYVQKQLADLLKNAGLEKIETVGTEFNPEFHEAIGQEINDEKQDDEILKEVCVGYKFYGKVLCPAKVIVNKKLQKK